MTSRIEGVAESANVIHVELLGHLLAALRDLGKEAPLLLLGVIQFREAVGHFHSSHVNLEPLGQRRILRLLFGKRRNVRGEVIQNGWLNQLVFGDGLKQQAGPLAIR